MALGTNFDVDLLGSGSGHEGVAAVAGYSCLEILGMDSLSHDFSSLPERLMPTFPFLFLDSDYPQ